VKKSRPDIIELLLKERKYHEEQIKRIDKAISLLSETPPPSSKDRVSWTEKIRIALENEPLGLRYREIKEKLEKLGIPLEKIKSSGSSIQTTLARMIRRGEIRKEGDRYIKNLPKGESEPGES